MKDKILKVLSYILVAAAASALSFSLCTGTTLSRVNKLEQLSNLIQQQFIGDLNVKEMEDAAAAAMVDSLGDRWSYYLTAEE